MEFIVELLLELFGEVLLQVVFQALAEAGLHLVRKRERPPALLATGYGLLGLIAGALSLLVFPQSLMHTRNGRVAALLLAPVAAGLATGLLGAWRQRRGQAVVGLDRFGYGYLFALAMALVRFFATR